MAKSRVIVDNRFRQYRRELDNQVEAALRDAGRVTAATARAVPTRYNLGPIRDKIVVGPVRRGFRGPEVTVSDRDFRAVFFESGTYQKLGRRLTKRSKAGAEGNRGVKPVHYMRRGRTAGRRTLIELLNRNLR